MRYQLMNEKGIPIALVNTPAHVARLIRADWTVVDIETGTVVQMTKPKRVGVHVRVNLADKQKVLDYATQLNANRDQ